MICGCGRDYLTVPLEEAHECPRPIDPRDRPRRRRNCSQISKEIPTRSLERAFLDHLQRTPYSYDELRRSKAFAVRQWRRSVIQSLMGEGFTTTEVAEFFEMNWQTVRRTLYRKVAGP